MRNKAGINFICHLYLKTAQVNLICNFVYRCCRKRLMADARWAPLRYQGYGNVTPHTSARRGDSSRRRRALPIVFHFYIYGTVTPNKVTTLSIFLIPNSSFLIF